MNKASNVKLPQSANESMPSLVASNSDIMLPLAAVLPVIVKLCLAEFDDANWLLPSLPARKYTLSPTAASVIGVVPPSASNEVHFIPSSEVSSVTAGGVPVLLMFTTQLGSSAVKQRPQYAGVGSGAAPPGHVYCLAPSSITLLPSPRPAASHEPRKPPPSRSRCSP
jgi:hypothetical protein